MSLSAAMRPFARMAQQTFYFALRCCCIASLVTGCLAVKEPAVCPDLVTRPGQIEHLQPLFTHLPTTPKKELAPWEKELAPWEIETHLGNQLARDLNWPQALWCFNRAALLAPDDVETKQKLALDQLLCRYFANQYQDAARLFEKSCLVDADKSWACYPDLLVILADSYGQLADFWSSDWRPKQALAHRLLERVDPERARRLSLRVLVQSKNLQGLKDLGAADPSAFYVEPLMQIYHKQSRNPGRAGLLNALLPGAGYWYVGQKQTAITSLALNALFAAAAWRFFQKGYPAAGLLTLSFEFGWYFGGIQGAQLAAKEYNRARFAPLGDKILREQRANRASLIQHGF